MRTNPNLEWLEERAQVQERPFTSDTPLIGKLIVWFREAWNSMSTKWYIRPLLSQQNKFNRLIVHQLSEHDAWLIDQDKENTTFAHDLAQLTTQVVQMNRKLEAIDAQLKQLESARHDQ